MTAGLRAAGAKWAHHTAQPVSPVAGPKRFTVVGDALNKDFFEGAVGELLLHCNIITSYIRLGLP